MRSPCSPSKTRGRAWLRSWWRAIFNLYYTTANEDGKTGHGVGLSLSRRLARLMGGDLRAVARNGRGGLFELELPIRTS